MKKLTTIILLLIGVCAFGQLDIVKRTLTVDTVKGRADSLYLKGDISINGTPIENIGGGGGFSETQIKTFATDTTEEHGFVSLQSDTNYIDDKTMYLTKTGSNLGVFAGSSQRLDIPSSAGSYVQFVGGGTTEKPMIAVFGSTTIPTYTWVNDNNTGLIRFGADNIGLQAGAVTALEATATITNIPTDLHVRDTNIIDLIKEHSGNDCFIIALSDSLTELTTANGDSWDWPYNCTIDSIQIGVNSPPTGSTLAVDIKQNGTTIFSTTITIDAGENTSVTAATDYTLSTTTLDWGDRMQAIASSVGATFGGSGLKVYIYYKKD